MALARSRPSRSWWTPKRDVPGTLMLGLLTGHRRHAHITALRGDAVAAQALGINKVVSERALRPPPSSLR